MNVKIGVCFSFLFVVLIPTAGGAGSNENSETAVTEIHFCHFRVPRHVKAMNASFSIVYAFQVNEGGSLAEPKKLLDRFLDLEAITECVEKWRLPDLREGSVVKVVAVWKHGIGWTQMSILSDVFNQRIIRSGDLNPYGSGEESDFPATSTPPVAEPEP
ncbi:MAG: hypothetical protein AAGC60_03620 [Acidobacteriota bacterium]